MLSQQLFNGLVVGSTYALFALGFTIMFGVLRVINLNYGVYFSCGSFLALGATQMLHVSIGVALLLAAVGAGLIAVVVDAVLLTSLRRRNAPELASLMVTLGATLVLYSAATVWFGTDIRRFPADVFDASAFEVYGVRITRMQVLIIGSALIAVLVLVGLMRGTRLGLAIRGVAERPEIAALMGINGSAVMRLVSFVSGAFGGAAGVLIGLNYNAIQPYMGESMMLKGFAVIILGGLGDIRGALVAGLIIGLLETLTAGYVASSWKDVVGFGLLVLTLWLRPAGLFGRTDVKRA